MIIVEIKAERKLIKEIVKLLLNTDKKWSLKYINEK